MKKGFKRVTAIALTVAMVFSSTAFNNVVAQAAVADDVSNAGYNLALGKTVTTNYALNEGKMDLLTDGKTNTGRVYPKEMANGYYTVDLDAYYTLESIDRIVFYYNETNVETYPSKQGGLILSYSKDGQTFYDAKQVTDTDVSASLWQDINVEDVNIAELDAVRYVRVSYPDKYTYGVQIREFAVINSTGEPEMAQIEMCDNAADITYTSTVRNELKYTVVAGDNQEGYTYDVYYNKNLIGEGVSAGEEYTVNDLKGGDGTLKVVSHYNGLISAGLEKNIHINHITDYANTEDNIALNKSYELSGGSSAEGNGNITNGTISHSDYATPREKEKPNAWVAIDLEEVYLGNGIDNITVWFRESNPGCAPQSGGMKLQYSTDGVTYSDVKNVQQSVITNTDKSEAPYYISIDLDDVKANAPAVRYVRVLFPNGVKYGAQITEIGVFDFDHDLAPAEEIVVNPPADFTAVGHIDTITGTITAPEEGNGYKYEVYLDGEKVLDNLDAGDYTIEGVIGGEHTVSVVSLYKKMRSTATVIENVNVTAGSVYESGALIEEAFADIDPVYGYNYVKYSGVYAKQSSFKGNSDGDKAIDGNLTTRWESEQSDPQYITVDLKNNYEIEALKLAWEAASARNYRVEVSADGRKFSTVSTIENTAGARTDSIVFNKEVRGRFVRIYGTARTTAYAYSIYELAIYGHDEEQEAIILAPLTKAHIFNAVDAGKGYQVAFSDSNKLTDIRTEGDSYEYVVSIQGKEYVVSKSGGYINLADAGLTVGEKYSGTVKAVYTSPEGIVEESPEVQTSSFTYTESALVAHDTGIASVHVRTSRTSSTQGVNLFTDETKTKVDAELVVKMADGKVNVTNFGTINVRGNSTKSAPKKAYNIKFDGKQDVLGMGKAKKWCLLANCFDKTLMRNQVAFYFQNALEKTQSSGNVYSSLVKPVDLYIDGYYLGSYLLTEAVEAGSTRVDIDGENPDNTETLLEIDGTGRDRASDAHLIKNVTYDADGNVDKYEYYISKLGMQFAVNEPGEDGEVNMPAFKQWIKDYEAKNIRIEAFLDEFEDAVIAKDYETVSQLADMESFVDFYITSEFFKTKDIGFSSTRYYIKEVDGQNKLFAGPLWDLDLSSGNANNNEKYDDPFARNENKWFGALMNIPEFKAAVAVRWEESIKLIHSIYDNGGVIDQTYDELLPSATLNYSIAHNVRGSEENDYNNGWSISEIYGASVIPGENIYGSTISHETYEEYVQDFKTWMTNRAAWMFDYLEVEDQVILDLAPVTKANIFNAVDAGLGYKVTFQDPNKITVAENDTYEYIVAINGKEYSVNKSGAYIDLSDAGLQVGDTYTATIRARYTSARGFVFESQETTTSKFVYTEEALVPHDTGIASVHVRTSRTSSTQGINLFTDESKTKVDGLIVVKKSDGSVDAADFGTINVRGNSTKSAPKKAYNFKYDSKQNVLKMGKAKKWCLLANCFDKTLMRNQVAFNFHNALEKTQSSGNVYSSLVKPVDLYIDGYYLGSYLLTEAVEAGSTRVDIDGENPDNTETLLEIDGQGRDRASDAHLIKNVTYDADGNVDKYEYYISELGMQFAVNEPGEDGEVNMPAFKQWIKDYEAKNTRIEAFLDEFEDAVIAKDYETVSQLADMESFVDFYITSEFFKTKDIGFSSTRYYIKEVDGKNKLFAGPLWDLDLSSGNANNNEKYDDPFARNENKWFGALMNIPEFKAAVAKRWEEKLELVHSFVDDGGVIDQTYDELLPSATLNYSIAHNVRGSEENDYNNGWSLSQIYGASVIPGVNVYGSTISHDTYEEYFDDFKTWMNNRAKWMNTYLGITDTLQPAYLTSEDGAVTLKWNKHLDNVDHYEVEYMQYGSEQSTSITAPGDAQYITITDPLANESNVEIVAILDDESMEYIGTAQALADLDVTDITFSNPILKEGQQTKIELVVVNKGTAVAEPSSDVISSKIWLDNKNNDLGWTAGFIGPVNPGETVTNYSFGVNWSGDKVTSGEHTIIGLIDERTKVAESNENNNELYKKVMVLKEASVVSSDVDLTGFQVSTTLGENQDEIGARTVYQVEPEVEDQKVVEVGLIYALEVGGNYPSEQDFVYGSSNKYVVNYKATEAGIINQKMGDSDTAQYYSMTMYAQGAYKQNYKVKAYTILKDGTVAYSEPATYNINDLAEYLYENNKMSTAAGHNALYEILKAGDPNYKEVSYEWNKILIDTNDSVDDVKIEGFQMSSSLNGETGNLGLRVVYSVEGDFDEVGLIYGIKLGNDPITEDDMVQDGAEGNKYINLYPGTEAGHLDVNMNTSTTASYYSRTMIIATNKVKAYYTSEYLVRAYAKRGDTIIYSDVMSYTIENVAASVYNGGLMSTYAGHKAIYDQILKKLGGYDEVDYKWSQNLVNN